MSRPAELADLEERSFWQATMPDLPDRRGRDLPDTADVVVIGGGYTGLSAARRAAELGASVVLLEAESLGWGASTRNGGMCHPGFKWGITSLRKRHGPELGERLYRESIEAFEAVATMCGPGGPIDADFSRSGHVELAFTPAHAAHQQATADALAQVDMPAHVVAREDLREEIGSDAYFGGLVVERSGGLHPGSSWRVSRRSPPLPGPTSTRASVPGRSAGRRTAARSSRHPDKPSSPATSSSPRTATRTAWPPRSGAGSCRSAATSSPPTRCPRTSRPSDQPRGRMFFDTKNFLYYWRLTPDRRMLFGGRASMWPTTIARTAAILQRGLVEVHPQLAGTRVAYAWGGRVGFTFDRMPHVGRSEGVTYAVGCCGSGVAILPWLGTRVAEWVGGGEAPALARLRFPLVPAPYEGRAWFLPLAGEWWRMRDRLAARAARDATPASEPEAIAGR